MSHHMEPQSAALRALPHPATTGIQQPAATTAMNHDQVSRRSRVSIYIERDSCCYVPVKGEHNG